MTENSDVKIRGLLLAAGGSRRMGTPKQLLEFEGKTLLRLSAGALVSSNCDYVVVVLGAEAEKSRAEIADLPVSIVVNENWESGMSSSIRSGLEKLLEIEPEIDAVMITLCDQPFVTAEKIDLFIEEFARNHSPVIAAKYGGVLGVPALFGKELFDELLVLKGDKGARDLIRKGDSMSAIDIPEAVFDLDTMDDWRKAGASRPY